MVAAHQLIHNWEDVWLVAVRLFGWFTAMWGVGVMLRMLRRSYDDKRVVIIPRPLVLFELGWLSVMAGFLTFLIVFDADALSSGWGFTVYASSLLWSLFGALWIIRHGTKESEAAAEVYEAVRRQLEEDRGVR